MTVADRLEDSAEEHVAPSTRFWPAIFPFFLPPLSSLFFSLALNKLRSSTEALYAIHIFHARNASRLRVPSAKQQRGADAARNNVQNPNALTFRKLESAR